MRPSQNPVTPGLTRGPASSRWSHGKRRMSLKLSGVSQFGRFSMISLTPIFVTGAIALLGLIITKESKVSEFRQAWIDSLRGEIADLLSSVQTCLVILTGEDGKIQGQDTLSAESLALLTTSLRHANTALFTVRLRLNPAEPASMAILSTLIEIEKLSNDNTALAQALASGRASELEAELTTQAKVVLSAEWRRVKVGEPYFLWTRRFAAALAIATAVIVGFQAIEQLTSIQENMDVNELNNAVASPARHTDETEHAPHTAVALPPTNPATPALPAPIR